MSPSPIDTDPSALWSWVKATTYGWWLGFAIVILLVLALETVVAVGEGAQFMVGVGMGAGVGYIQGRRMNEWLGTRHRWLLATTIGMGGPFVVGDIASAAGFDVPSSLALYVAAGSLLVGILQWNVLRHHLSGAAWWVPASVLGWMLPAALLALNDRQIVAGVAGEAVALIGMFFGGVILGLVTGAPLAGARLRPAD